MPCIAHKFIYALCLCAYKLQREWKREWNRLTDRYFRARVYRIHTYIHTYTHPYVFVRVIILSEVQSDRASLHPFYMDDSGLLRKTHTHTYDLRCMSLLSRQDATIRPVLKHGPRSSTGLRVVEFLTRLFTHFIHSTRRSESNLCAMWNFSHFHCSTSWLCICAGPSGRTYTSCFITRGLITLKSSLVETRKMVNYARTWWSQEKSWWKLALCGTDVQIVAARPEYRGERLIEPSSSWFPPKFPSG